ncbi:unnamed protein product [Thelazia callipaeda]|uniref:DUF659 domain-containing protein n=1 Tax=Thelazia callipaeda TaxID=103827 RepID=A0A0N5CL20_THECL|nr:unnamed protein product [Thelazia callipaeda]
MAVVIPLAVQISESIMVFQEKAPTISARVLRKCVQKDSDPSMKHEIVPFKAPLEPLPDFTDTLTDAHSQLLTSFIAKIQETRDFWGIGPRLTCFNSTWAASDDSAFCWNDTKLVNNLKDADKLVLSDGYESNFTTTVFLIERLKLLMLSNRLLESFEGRRMNNESIDSDVEGSGFPYISVDDEDGDEFEDGGSGLDENQPAIVIDIAGSHRDISEPSATDKSDLQSTTTVVPELKVTQPKVNVTVAKISTRQKPSIFISLIVLVIIHAS